MNPPKFVIDAYLGKMEVTYDRLSKNYYLDKAIEIKGVKTTILLYVESSTQRLSKHQYIAYQKILQNFDQAWSSIKQFLIQKKEVVTLFGLNNDYAIESITIPELAEGEMKWTIDLTNKQDGFTRISIDMKDTQPIDVSIEG